MNFAVVGDIHANIFALDACLDSLIKFENSQDFKFDKIFFIGDLLTYGVNINNTLEKLVNYGLKNNVEFILGNHDEMYHQLLTGQESYYFKKLPEWIKSSVDLTLEKLDKKLFKSINMNKFFSLGQLLICHANSLILDSANKDKWIYIDSLESYLEEADRLKGLNYKLAVYGHTHRRKIFFKEKYQEIFFNEKPNFEKFTFDLSKSSPLIINAGSIGQPRSLSDLDCAWLFIKEDLHNNIYQINFINFEYDINRYLKSIDNAFPSNLECANKIKSFFTKYDK
tara:strand:- start:2008 stop:2853 length:846 start_codon:yes stop_codon:yes gene_type:complete